MLMTFTVSQAWTFVIAVFGLALTVINIIDKVSSFKKNAHAPLDIINQRLDVLETKISTVELSQKMEMERNNEQDRTNEVVIRSTLALIDFEMQYCITERKQVTPDLQRAHSDLKDYLASK